MMDARDRWEWRGALKEWEDDARRDGAPETTIRTRLEHLRLLAKTIGSGPWAVSEDALREWFAGRAWAPNTYRSRRTTFRAFYAWAVTTGRVASSPAHGVPPGEVPTPMPRPVSDRALALAWASASARERLMIRLAAEHGLRRAEVAVVWPDRDLVEDLTGWSLVVHGKGGKDRVVPLLDEVARELRALGPGWAFPGNDGGHLSPRWVGTLIGRLLPGDYTMHKLRHRAGTLWHEEIGDLAVVQDLLGHADPKTTRAYVQASRAKMRAAVEGAARRRS